MKNSIKFWLGIAFISIMMFILLASTLTLLITLSAIFTLFIFLSFAAMLVDGTSDRDMSKSKYEIPWRINAVYWLRQFNNLVDKL